MKRLLLVCLIWIFAAPLAAEDDRRAKQVEDVQKQISEVQAKLEEVAGELTPLKEERDKVEAAEKQAKDQLLTARRESSSAQNEQREIEQRLSRELGRQHELDRLRKESSERAAAADAAKTAVLTRLANDPQYYSLRRRLDELENTSGEAALAERSELRTKVSEMDSQALAGNAAYQEAAQAAAQAKAAQEQAQESVRQAIEADEDYKAAADRAASAEQTVQTALETQKQSASSLREIEPKLSKKQREAAQLEAILAKLEELLVSLDPKKEKKK